MKPKKPKPKSEKPSAVGSTALLDNLAFHDCHLDKRRRLPNLRRCSNAHNQLAKINDDLLLRSIKRLAKKKGVRFVVSDLPEGCVEHYDKGVVIFRGRASRLLDRIFDGFPSIRTGNDN